MSLRELVLSGLLLTGLLFFVYYIFKGRVDYEENEVDIYSLSYLCREIKRIINEIVSMDLTQLNLNQKDYDNRKALKRSQSDAVRKCSQGDMVAKTIVFSRIKRELVNNLGINEDVIDETLPFNNPERLTSTDKFEIMYYLQKRSGSHRMFRDICGAVNFDRLKKDEEGYYYDVTEEDVANAYDKLYRPLSYDDKLNILTQRIYEETYGLSAVDLMIMEDDSLDGVSGGVSGITTDNFLYQEEDMFLGNYKKAKTFDSIWIIYSGKPIHMKFMSFRTKENIVRICMNLSEHGRVGHFTSAEGGIKTHLADGSRATIFRPDNSSQWAFFVRKFGSTAYYELKDLINDKGSKYPLGIIKWGILGCLNLFFSGDANSGKTTNVRAAVRYIDRRQPVRTIEADFELYMNDAYSDKNIIGMRPSERLPFPKIIELLKASDAHTILFGETAHLEHAKHLIDLLLAGTKRILTTGHWPTTDELIAYFVHSMGGFGNAGTQELEAMIARLVHLDIHCVRENNGDRHIDRITEVIPYSRIDKEPEHGVGIEGKLDEIAYYLKILNRGKAYETRDIIVFKDGEYHMVNPISKELSEIILRNLPPEEREEFKLFNMVPEGGEARAS